MDINALKTFLEVAKTRHFGHAAEQLFVTQSTVSARIKTLEENLGCELFIRERSNLHLSKSGEALIPHAKSIMTLWGRARQELVMPQGARDTLVIGGLSGLWDITLQDWLAVIAGRYPSLALVADIFSASTLVDRIMNGTMDVAFLYDAPQGLNLISQPLATIQLRLVSSQPKQSVEQALGEQFVNVNWGLNFAVQFASTFPDVAGSSLTTGLGRIALNHIKNHAGSAYLAEPTVQQAVHDKQIYYVADAPIFQRNAYAIYHRENDKSDLIQSLIGDL